MTRKTRTNGTEPQRDNFTMVPNIVLTMDLTAHQLRLYLQIKMVAGEDNVCWQTAEALAKACRMSTGEVSKAKAKLISEGLISIVPHMQGSRQSHQIKVIEVWHKNHALYHQVPLTSPGDLSDTSLTSPGDLSHHQVTCQIQASHHLVMSSESAPDTPKIPLKEPLNKDPLRAPAKKRVTEITEAFRAEMRERFMPVLGSTVDERIDEALAHRARLKYTDLQQYVQGWLRRDAEKLGAAGQPGNGRLSIHQRRMLGEKAIPVRKATYI